MRLTLIKISEQISQHFFSYSSDVYNNRLIKYKRLLLKEFDSVFH